MTSLQHKVDGLQQDVIIRAYGVALVEHVLVDELFAKLSEDGIMVLGSHAKQYRKLEGAWQTLSGCLEFLWSDTRLLSTTSSVSTTDGSQLLQ